MDIFERRNGNLANSHQSDPGSPLSKLDTVRREALESAPEDEVQKILSSELGLMWKDPGIRKSVGENPSCWIRICGSFGV